MGTIQDTMNTVSKMLQETRSNYHLCLGELIHQLKAIAAVEGDGLPIWIDKVKNRSLANPHSYRGYYEDIAFEVREGLNTARGLVEMIELEVLDKSFMGYKGGDFVMGGGTPIWIANYGQTGRAVVGISLLLDENLQGYALNIETKEIDS